MISAGATASPSRSTRVALGGLARPPLKELRFWSTQIMVGAVVLLHGIVDIGQDRGVWGIPSFVVISLLVVPVIYGAMSYGLVGALGPALTGTLLIAPTELWMPHSNLELWGGWSNIVVVFVVAIVLGERFEFTRRSLIDHARRDEREREQRRFRLAFDNNLSAMAVLDGAGRLEQANQALCDLLGYSPRELIGMRLAEVTHPGDVAEPLAQSGTLAHLVPQGRAITRFVRRDSRAITAEVSEAVVSDERDAETLSVISIRDVTEERLLTARLADLALHDSLTGLANRSLLRDRMAQARARSERDGGRAVLFLLDLDHFKGVNDTLGHGAGDQLLVGVAKRLRNVCREVDTVSRLGGDEFVVLANDVGDDDALAVADRLLGAFERPFDVDGHEILQGASIGVVFCSAAEADCDELLRNADIALYEAKRRGRGQVALFDPTMGSESVEHFHLSQDLAVAASRGQIAMHYQPIIELASGRVTAFEALMRWSHPERGAVPPDVFIPLAEQSDLIIQLGTLALVQASADAASWARQGQPWQVGVNLSARQMNHPDLLAQVDAALSESGLPAKRLVIEITEGIAVADIDAAIRTLDSLRRRGISVALDDFGTGYSSLAYLARLHPSTIKIDRAFIHAASQNSSDRNLLAAMVTLCRQLGMVVLAEGVETRGELNLLLELGVDLAQGFLFSAAVPAHEVATTVRRVEATWAEHLSTIGPSSTQDGSASLSA